MDSEETIKQILNLTFKGRVLAIYLSSFVLFLIGALVKSYTGPEGFLAFPAGTPLIIIILVLFTAGFLFFGYLTPLIMFLIGHYTHYLIIETGSFLSPAPILLIISSFIVSYAGIMLGDTLLRDISGRGNFLEALKISLIILVIGIAIAGIGDLLAAPIGSPGWTVERHIEEINEGNLEEATRYLETERRITFLDQIEESREEIQFMEQMMEEMDIEADIIEEDILNGDATVKAEIETSGTFNNQTITHTEEKEFYLIRESNRWKLTDEPTALIETE